MRRAIGALMGLAALVPLAAACGGGGNGTGRGASSTTTTTSGSSSSTSSTASTSSPPVATSTTTTSTVPSTSTTRRATAPATLVVRVWFLDRAHAQTGEEPLFRAVEREVQAPAVAAGALDALFAGPTPAERAGGLDLVLSGATGYSHLHVEDGIAYVRLEGGCSSGGSTITIAGEIMPTLRQFASVDHVKIFAPDGTTEEPAGATDSIPECLEP